MVKLLNKNSASNESADFIRDHIVPFLPGIIFTVILFFPGSMSNDSFRQLLQARKHIYSDHHPPLMAYLWRYLDLIIRGPFLWLCLQTAAIWLTLGYIVRRYFNQAGVKHYIYLSIAATYTILLFPPIVGIIGAVWKDIFMLALITACTAIIFKIKRDIDGNGFSRKKVISLIIILFALTIANCSRHNAFAAVFFIIWYTCYNYRLEGQPRFLSLKLFASFFVSLVALLIILVLSNFLNYAITDKKSYIQQTVYLYDLGHIAALSKDLKIINKDLYNIGGIIDTKLSMRMLTKSFNVKSNSRYFREIGFKSTDSENKVKEIRNIWLKSIRKHPYEYFKWRYLVFINMIKNIRNNHLFIVYSVSDDRQKKTKIYITQSKFQKLMNGFLRIVPKVFYNPLFYFVISIALFIMVPIINWDKYNFIWFVLGSGLSYQLSLFFSVGTADYRYSHYMVFCTVSSIILILFPMFQSILEKRRIKSLMDNLPIKS